MSYNPSLAELLAHSPNAAITERINTLISARWSSFFAIGTTPSRLLIGTASRMLWASMTFLLSMTEKGECLTKSAERPKLS